MTAPHAIDTVSQLEALFGEVGEASIKKEVPYLHPAYQALIAASPFAVLATTGPGGPAQHRGRPARGLAVPDSRRRRNAARERKGAYHGCAGAHGALRGRRPGAAVRDRDPAGAPRAVPTPGAILSALADSGFDGEAYDRELPARQRATLY